MPLSKSEQARIAKATYPEKSNAAIARELGISPSTVVQALEGVSRTAATIPNPNPDPDALAKLAVRLLSKSSVSPATLANSLGCDIADLDAVLAKVEETTKIENHGGLLTLSRPSFGYIPVDVSDGGEWTDVGLVSDTHLACKEERLDALHAMYDIFDREGVKDVYHAGNIVDGYIQRINGSSVICSTAHDQAQYVVDNYPQRPGVTTYFITGDDHESWFMKDGFNFGAYLEMLAKHQGRHDLVYAGHVEADVEFKTRGGSAIMKVQHPGGGSAYARSYTGQKMAESFQGGEKPAILVQGHYHVSNYMVERNVHVVSMPGFQDQTIFARKKKLRMEIGGALLSFKQNHEDGSISRLRLEFKLFFDRGYYKPFLRSDAKLLKGHIVKTANPRKKKSE